MANKRQQSEQRQEAMTFLTKHAFKEAEQCCRVALEQTLDQKNAETYMWMQRLSESLIGQKKFTEAETLAKQALSGYSRFGPDDEDVLDCKYLQAECLHGQRKFPEAGELAQSALAGLQSNLKRGPDHATTLKCRGLLAMILKCQFKIAEGTELAKYNRECLEAVINKAEGIESMGSRKLTEFERDALQKVEVFSAYVLGEKEPSSPGKNKPKRTSTIETVSTDVPENGSRLSSCQNSRHPSKELTAQKLSQP